jgi:hypothetical protein
MWPNRKRRKEKIVKIEPLKVLQRSFRDWGDLKEYEITELRYRVKSKPTLYDSFGKSHYIYRGSGVYYDTPKNRELISLIQELEVQINLLTSELSEFATDLEIVDVSKLHERSLQDSGGSADK